MLMNPQMVFSIGLPANTLKGSVDIAFQVSPADSFATVGFTQREG
jgi:hypothetical protein